MRLIARYCRNNGIHSYAVTQIATDSLVWWISTPDQPFPVMVAKLAMTPLQAQLCHLEAEALSALEPISQRLRIPRLLVRANLAPDRVFLLQSGVSGTPCSETSPPITTAIAWLMQFQKAAAAVGTAADALCLSMARCQRRLGHLTDGERTLMQTAERCLPELAVLPAFPIHGDFWAGNLLRSAAGIGVIDWSNYRSGSPLDDLLTLLASSVHCSHGREGIWRFFFTPTPLNVPARRAIEDMLAVHAIPRTKLAPLITCFLVHRLASTEFSDNDDWRATIARAAASGIQEPPRSFWS